jgi:hypothetical protein
MINEGKTQVIYFSRRLGVLDNMLQLNNVTYIGVTFDRMTT